MQQLQAILKANKVDIDDEQLAQIIRDYGLDPDNLNEDDCQTLATELIQQTKPSAMTKSQGKNGSKPAPKKRTNRKSRTAKPNAMQKAVNNVNGQSESDMAAFLTAIDSRSTKRAKEVASEALDIIADTPNRCLDHFVELAEEYQGDPNFFRGIGEEWADAIFGTSSADAAQQDDRNTSVA